MPLTRHCVAWGIESRPQVRCDTAQASRPPCERCCEQSARVTWASPGLRTLKLWRADGTSRLLMQHNDHTTTQQTVTHTHAHTVHTHSHLCVCACVLASVCECVGGCGVCECECVRVASVRRREATTLTHCNAHHSQPRGVGTHGRGWATQTSAPTQHRRHLD